MGNDTREAVDLGAVLHSVRAVSAGGNRNETLAFKAKLIACVVGNGDELSVLRHSLRATAYRGKPRKRPADSNQAGTEPAIGAASGLTAVLQRQRRHHAGRTGRDNNRYL